MDFKDTLEHSLHALTFMRPAWLLGIILVMVFSLWQIQRRKHKKTALIANHLSEHLVTLPTSTKKTPWLVNMLLVIACIALSGPSFRSIKTPVYEIQKAQVIAFDLSFSMFATDIKPNRLSQAKYKAIDLLKAWGEGEKGLIAYAGDAFTISPLTHDSNAVINHIHNLSPLIMPVRGSRPDLALQKSIELLTNAGYQQGQIVFITDGFDQASVDKMQAMVAGTNWMVSVLAVATTEGAPIKLPDGSLLKDSSDHIVIPTLQPSTLYPITQASKGLYLTLNTQGKDVSLLTEHYEQKNKREETQQKSNNKQLIDDGYWLSLLLLPLCLFFFRKGMFYLLLLTMTLPMTTPKAQASIWENNQQNAYQAFQEGDYKGASQQFESLPWKAAALFKAKQYKQAEAAYADQVNAHQDDKQALYNLGNSQAIQKKYQQALQSFTQALHIDPNFVAAQKNKKAVEDLLKQQQQQKKQQQQNNKQSTDKKNQSSADQQNQSSSDQQNQSSADQQNQSSADQKNQSSADQKNQSSADQQNQSSADQQNQSSADQQNQQSANQPNQPSADQKNQSSADQQNQSSADQQNQSSADQKNQSSADQQNQSSAEQQAQAQGEKTPEPKEAQAAAAQAKQSDNQEYEALPTWLKNMPDDPALLLRNKMQLEYQKRNANQSVNQQNNGEIW